MINLYSAHFQIWVSLFEAWCLINFCSLLSFSSPSFLRYHGILDADNFYNIAQFSQYTSIFVNRIILTFKISTRVSPFFYSQLIKYFIILSGFNYSFLFEFATCVFFWHVSYWYHNYYFRFVSSQSMVNICL